MIAFSCRGLRLNLVVLLCHLAYQCLNLNIMDFIFMPLIFIWLIIVMIVPDYVTILFVQNIEDWTKTLFALYSSLRGEFYAQPRCLHQRRRFLNINFANLTVKEEFRGEGEECWQQMNGATQSAICCTIWKRSSARIGHEMFEIVAALLPSEDSFSHLIRHAGNQ